MLKIVLDLIKDAEYKKHATDQTLHNQKKPAPLKKFMEEHNGTHIDTIQVRFESNQFKNTIKSAWAPSNRLVDTKHATYVLLNGSRRDYKNVVLTRHYGVYLDKSDDTVLIFFPTKN